MGLFSLFKSKSDKESICRAARNGDILLVRQLLEKGVDVNCIGDGDELEFDGIKFHDYPLNIAIRNSHIDVIKLLLDYGADLNARCPLYWAVGGRFYEKIGLKVGNINIVQILLDRGANIDCQFGSGENKYELRTPLDNAVITEGNKSVVELLVKHGAEVHGLRKNILETPLARLFIFLPSDGDQNFDEKVKILVQADAKLNLHLVAGLGDMSKAESLIESGCEVNELLYDDSKHLGYMPLYFAIRGNRLEMVKLLLINGADPNEGIGNGDDPLFTLIYTSDNVAMFKLLLDHGARIKEINVDYPYRRSHINAAEGHERQNILNVIRELSS